MQITLSKRGMAEFDASAFSTKEEREMLYAITKLDVSFNSLSLVKGMQCLSNLTSLDVSYNKVKSLAGLPLKLRRLNVSHNELKYLDGLTPLSQLEWIDVSHNELLSLGGLPGTQGLKYVDASHNRIGSLKGIELCTGIHELHVTHNLLRKVDDLIPLRYLRAIRHLLINDNPVTSNPRNFTAIRLLVPNVQHIDAAAGSGTALSHLANTSGVIAQRDGTLSAFQSVSANYTTLQHLPSSARPTSPKTDSRAVTPNASTISISSAKGISPTRPRATQVPAQQQQQHATTSSAFRRTHSASSTIAASEGTTSLYQSLLKSLDPTKAQRAASAFTIHRAQSADKASQSPRRGLTLLSTASSNTSQQVLPAAKLRSAIYPQEIHNSSEIGRSLQDASTSSIAAQRLLEQRVEELEREVREAKKTAAEATREADNFKLQVKQLKETIERQAKVNQMLSDANRQLSIEASRLQLNAPKLVLPITQGGNPSSGPQKRKSDVGSAAAANAASLRSSFVSPEFEVISTTTTAHAEGRHGSEERSSTPTGGASGRISPSAVVRLNSPKTTGIAGYAAKSHSAAGPAVATSARGTITGGGKKARRADMSPKRGSMTSDVRELMPQTGQPTFVVPAARSPRETRSSSSSKNVSFGGSQFYSPPQNYYR